MPTTQQYDALNRLTRIGSVSSAGSVVDFQYGYNAANQRTNIILGPDNSHWDYAYDALGQVTSGKKHWPDGSSVAGQQFEYQFDSIGNRKQTKAGGDNSGQNLRAANYTNNLLNQITGRDVPGAADILGIAHASATVTVNGQSTSRKGEYYWKGLGISNQLAAIYQGVTTTAYLAGTTNTTTGSLLLPMSPQRFFYDADGNLLSDGVWTNTWDAENRLVSTETTTAVPQGARAKETWSYYPDGRWAERVIYAWTNSAWSAQTTQRFIWDGNLIVAILDVATGSIQTFLRGLDLSGTMQRAGGAGGLLATTDDSTGLSCFYAHDGNGSVVALVNFLDGTVAARYEYGPFAEPIRMTGPMALANPMRFSGQFADDVLRTLKYLHREYVPSTGRWLSRDPIDQKGGINLYSFVLNDPIDAFDLIGEKPFWCGPLEKKIRSYLSTPEELRAWDQFVNGSGDIKLSVNEMDSIVNSSARYTTVLDAWMADCTKPWAAWTDRVATIADTLGSPWAYAIGQLSITLKSSCHCGCLSF